MRFSAGSMVGPICSGFLDTSGVKARNAGMKFGGFRGATPWSVAERGRNEGEARVEAE